MRLVVFEFGSRGHYASYAAALLEGWQRLGSDSTIRFVVTPDFVDFNPLTVAAITSSARAGVELTVIDPEEQSVLRDASRLDRVPWSWIAEGPELGSRSRTEWDIIQKYGQRFGADLNLAMEIDHLMPALASNMVAAVPISGIWFKPTFHYRDFDPAQANISGLHEMLVVARLLANPGMTHLFCLDPFAADKLRSTNHGYKIVAVPDPVQDVLTPSHTTSKEMIGIDSFRHALLIFGNISARKGVPDILAALEHLTDQQRQRLCIILAGVPLEIDETQLRQTLLRLKGLGIQVIEILKQIPETEIPIIFAASDTVLATYRKHAGSSGVILRAALHGRPVLSQDYGLMGKMVRDHRLGLTVRSSNAADIALGIERSLDGAIQKAFDPKSAALLAAQHSHVNFSDIILRETLASRR